MESRDSPSVSASINLEMTTNEYCVVSASSVLATDAALLFKSQKFSECFEVLDQISQKEQRDPKVLHNSAITKYLRDGCLDPHKLLEVLNNVRQRSQEITQALSEKLDDVPDAGNKFTANVKGNNFIEPPQVFAGSNSIYMDECDSFIAILNMATICFNLHEYRKALSFLEPLFQNIEPIDEKTALHICLLLLDVALACNDAHKAAEVIIYMEKAFGLGPTQPSDPVPAPHPPQQPSAQTLKSPPPLPTTPLAPMTTDTFTLDPPLERDVSDDTFSYDTLLSTLDSVIGIPGSVGPYSRVPPNPSPTDPSPKRPIPLADLKLKLQLYRVRLLLLTKNVKAAKREVKLTMNTARGSSDSSSSSAALILKSQLEYTRGNHRKAVKLLMASGGKPDAEILINNNLGCIYYHLGKPHTASVFFSRSLRLISSIRKEKPPKTDRSHHLLYNCGVQYLSSSKPDLAFRCFQKAAVFFSHRPLLWLRMAECCLTTTRPSHANPIRVLGQGASRQLAIENPAHFIRIRPELSTATARECLLNALHLLEKKTKKNTPLSGILQSSVSEHDSYCQREEANMKRAILADLSYVDLELGNPSMALYHANLLLGLTEPSKTYGFLGRMYAAEALCLLHRHTEAAEQLRIYLTDEDEPRPPFSEQEWREAGTGVVTPDEARGILYVDLAVMFAARGDWEKAGWFISKAPEAVVSKYPEAVMVHVYVDLMMHRKQEALQKLRCGKSLLFLPHSGAL